ncbi:hypothetical protein BVRB_7g169360 [Beta vulgaris subsp. vulgaris]|nr:hypothetical protein BVRB_7g169360 [Beta vulgaris subsp. vulgaris]
MTRLMKVNGVVVGVGEEENSPENDAADESKRLKVDG